MNEQKRNCNDNKLNFNSSSNSIPSLNQTKFSQNPNSKKQEPSNHYLPSSLINEINTLEDQDELNDENANGEFNREENYLLNLNNSIWSNNMCCYPKTPSLNTKDKYYSFDNFPKHTVSVYKKQTSLPIDNPGTQNPSIQFNNTIQYQKMIPNRFNQLNQSNYPLNQGHNFLIQTQLYNGNYIMPPYMSMNQFNQINQNQYENNLINFNIKKQKEKDEKILSNPKRFYSSPGVGTVSSLKSKDSDKTPTESIKTFEEMLSYNNSDLFSYIITQKGSREVQRILHNITPSNLELLINNLSIHFSDLMIDKYGNYFCQKLIKNCTPELRICVLKSIQNRFIEISCNIFGTHSLQSFIEIANMVTEQDLFREYIEKDVIKLALDPQGTHVFQKFIICCYENQLEKIGTIIVEQVGKLINDSHGVCVLIKYLSHNKNKISRVKLVEYISKNALEIIQNPFGNYVVQNIILNSDTGVCNNILQIICDHFFSLSMQKFSSNVVESTINIIDEKTLSKLFHEVVDNEKLPSMIKNSYGSFVIEKMVTRLNKDDRVLFIQELKKLGKEKSLSSSLANFLSQ